MSKKPEALPESDEPQRGGYVVFNPLPPGVHRARRNLINDLTRKGFEVKIAADVPGETSAGTASDQHPPSPISPSKPFDPVKAGFLFNGGG